MFRKDALSYVAGDIVGGRYRVTGSLGRGGFGAVYSAVHTMTGQPMALKMLTIDPSTTEDDVVERFYREARITAQLTDVHTVQVFDVGEAENGPLFMAMEMLRGPPLDKLLRRLGQANRPMSEAETIDIALPILQSLSEAHKAGLVHRDLKPANIILAHKGDEQMVVKVLDFGIARTQDSSLTGQGTALGTPAYMSPEQVRGKPLDGRSDLYSLGIIMFRCLTGRMPFEHEDAFAQAFMHLSVPAPDPREIAEHPISDAIAEVVLCAMSKDAEERFDDARTMRQALQEIRGGAFAGTPVAGTPVLAHVADAENAIATRIGTKPGGSLMDLLVDVQHESLRAPSVVIAAYTETEKEATRIHRNDSPDEQPTNFVGESFEQKLQALEVAGAFDDATHALETVSPSDDATRALMPASSLDEATRALPTSLPPKGASPAMDSSKPSSAATLAVTAEELQALRDAREERPPTAAPKPSKAGLYAGAAAVVMALGVAAALSAGSGDEAPAQAANVAGQANNRGAVSAPKVAATSAAAGQAAGSKPAKAGDGATTDKPTPAPENTAANKPPASKPPASKPAGPTGSADAGSDNAAVLAGRDRNLSMKLVAQATKEADPHTKLVLLKQAVRLDPDNEAYAALLGAAEKVVQRQERAEALRPTTTARSDQAPTKPKPKPKPKPKHKHKPKVEEPYVDF